MVRPQLLIGGLLIACASPPLGDDFASLDGPGRQARAVEVLRDAFASSVDGVGNPRVALSVTACDAREIAWTTADGEESRLRWVDVDTVESQVLPELPAKPESLYLYLHPDSPSTQTIAELQVPLLANAGVARPFLQLSQRAARSRVRVVAALDELRTRVPAPAVVVKPDAGPPAVVAPVDTRTELDRTEEVLERLKRWHVEGLITQEEYERKRREVLERVGGGAPLPPPTRQE